MPDILRVNPDELRAATDVQARLTDAQRFNLWEMLRKAGGGCVVGGGSAGVVGLITGGLDPLIIGGACVGGAINSGGDYILDHTK